MIGSIGGVIMAITKKRRVFNTSLFLRSANGSAFVFIFDDFTNVTLKSITYFVKYKAIVSYYLVFIIVIDYMVLDVRSFRKLVTAYVLLFKHLIKC